MLVCPISGNSLSETAGREKVSDALGQSICRLDGNRREVQESDITDRSLLRSDGRGVYPVSSGIPILLAPEMLISCDYLGTVEDCVPLDTSRDPYREAYIEMDFYNSTAMSAMTDAEQSEIYRAVSPVVGATDFPSDVWLDATYDILSQQDSYNFLAPMQGATALQVGGSGVHAVKFLLAGASESWLMTPMLSEAVLSSQMAESFGVGDRFKAVVGIAEQLPFRDASFDRIFSGGCIHHTITEMAFPEFRRVLKDGGRFAAVEPWRAPMYKLGTTIFGKREQPVLGNRNTGVICRPLEDKDVEPLFRTFKVSSVNHHGAFTRYSLIALGKLGLRLQPKTVSRVTRADDRLASKFSVSQHGSSVALLAEKNVVDGPH